MKRIAVVGSGISGLAAAWLLSRRYRVTLYEAAPQLGGHAHTVEVTLEGRRFPVDTGFLVFNRRTYPNLTALFDTLGVEVTASEMSFAVSLAEPELEWAGSSLATLFAQKRNLARPQFWSMLQDILRFNRETSRLAQAGATAALVAGRVSGAFRLRPGVSRLVPAADGGGDLVLSHWAACSTTRWPPSCASVTTTACCRFSIGRSG